MLCRLVVAFLPRSKCLLISWLQPLWASLVAHLVKNPLGMQETWLRSLGWEDALEKGMGAHSNILAWSISWTIQSMGLQRVGHD